MNAVKLTLVDYSAGNLPSVERALGRLGVETQRAATLEALAGSGAIVLPGVGHFGQLMRTLEERGLRGPLRDAITRGIPFFGICLGLQALFASSEEDPSQPGLGIFGGSVQPLPRTAKLPHMGWNQLRRMRSSVLLRDVRDDAYFYFAHSFAALDAADAAVAVCDHGVPFVAMLEQENVLAVQFHPEKSGDAGALVLRNFVEFARAKAAREEAAR